MSKKFLGDYFFLASLLFSCIASASSSSKKSPDLPDAEKVEQQTGIQSNAKENPESKKRRLEKDDSQEQFAQGIVRKKRLVLLPPQCIESIQEEKTDPSHSAHQKKSQVTEVKGENPNLFSHLGRGAFSIITSFLQPRGLASLSFSSKTVYQRVLNADVPFSSLEKIRSVFGWRGVHYSDLENVCKLSKEQIVEFLSKPEKALLLRKCVNYSVLCLHLDKKMMDFLNQNLKDWKNKVDDIKLPLVLLGGETLNFLKDPILLPHIASARLMVGFGQPLEVDNDWVSIIEKNNILFDLVMFPIKNAKDTPPFVSDLCATKKVMKASLSRLLFGASELELTSLKELWLDISFFSQFYEMVPFLNEKVPNLECLYLHEDKYNIGINNLKVLPEPLTLKNLKVLGIHFPIPSLDSEFKAFYQSMPSELKEIRLATEHHKFNYHKLLELGEHFKSLARLTEIRVELAEDISLARFLTSLKKHKNLVDLTFKLDYEQWQKPKMPQDPALQSEEGMFAGLKYLDLRIAKPLVSESSESFQKFAENVLGVLPLLNMHIEPQDQIRDKKYVYISDQGFENPLNPGDWKKELSYFAQIIQNSGSHVEFKLSKDVFIGLNQENLISEQHKKRLRCFDRSIKSVKNIPI